MKLLRECIRSLIVEASTFDEWLSPDVVNLLVAKYAETTPGFGSLDWEYSDRLKSNVWGQYHPNIKTLYVNRAKTKNLFKQQVTTILHEIEHWNQHTRIAAKFPNSPISSFNDAYSNERKAFGYWNQPMEIGARRFANLYVDDAMETIGKHYGGKLSDGSVDTAVDELMNDYIDNDEKPLTKVQVGQALKNFDLNTPDNMKAAVEKLRSVGVKVLGA